MMAERLVQDAPLNSRTDRGSSEGVPTVRHRGRARWAGLGGIPVEYKGGTVPPPDQRRNYS